MENVLSILWLCERKLTLIVTIHHQWNEMGLHRTLKWRAQEHVKRKEICRNLFAVDTHWLKARNEYYQISRKFTAEKIWRSGYLLKMCSDCWRSSLTSYNLYLASHLKSVPRNEEVMEIVKLIMLKSKSRYSFCLGTKLLGPNYKF